MCICVFCKILSKTAIGKKRMSVRVFRFVIFFVLFPNTNTDLINFREHFATFPLNVRPYYLVHCVASRGLIYIILLKKTHETRKKKNTRNHRNGTISAQVRLRALEKRIQIVLHVPSPSSLSAFHLFIIKNSILILR